MKKLVAMTIGALISSPTSAGLQPFERLPAHTPAVKLDEPFSEKYWVIAGVRVDDGLSEHDNVVNVINSLGGAEPFAYDHHTVVCYQNNEGYLYFYESGWGPGYALSSAPLLDRRACETTEKELELGSGVEIGMPRNKLEELIGVSQGGDVYDVQFEEVIDELVAPSKVCPLWHAVTLKILLEDDKVTAVYFDEHTEPYDDCRTI